MINRYQKILRERYRQILYYLGLLLAFAGIVLLIPLLVIPFFPKEVIYAWNFIVPGISAIVIGYLLSVFFKPRGEVTLDLHEGGVIVVLAWICSVIISTVPFMTGLKMSFTHSLFETVSGWTTTGLSVVDVENTSEIFLLWRSLMQFFGGVGLVVVMLASILHPRGFGLYNAEGRSDKLLPNLKRSTRLIFNMYLGFTLAGVFLYKIAGMSLFDAINHAMPALSTGGFSTRASSIAYWNSLPIEMVSWVLMLVGTMNFATAYVLLKGKIKLFLKNAEIQLMAFLLAVFTPLLVYLTLAPTVKNMPQAWRAGIFQAISALSTTGFSTVDFTTFNSFGVMVIILLMLIGGGTGSTAGGIKLYRVYLMIRSLIWEIWRQFLPNNVVKRLHFWRGDDKVYINDEHVRETSNFIFIYGLTYMIGVLIFLAHGYGIGESMFEFASSLGTVGLSIGITSAAAPSGILWTMIGGMFLGRLEFMVIFYSLVKIGKDLRDISVKTK